MAQPLVNDFSRFNISSTDWGISHSEVVAGLDWVCVHYNFLANRVLHLKNRDWKIEFMAYPESTDFTDRWTFY